jgi:predicted MFS family arabinose efflux permease
MIRNWWKELSREYKLLLWIWLFVGISGGIYDAVFNNYLNDVFHISSEMRGWLELPREAPGFLIAIISGLLIFLVDVRLLGVAIGLIALGMYGQSFYNWTGEPQFGWMMFAMVVWSTGMHLFMPVSSSITMRLAKKGQTGRTLGIFNGVQTIAIIIGGLIIWYVMGQLKLAYDITFQIAALCAVIAVGVLLLIKIPKHDVDLPRKKFKLVFRKEYSTYYWLSIIFGARKQVFMTFAPWIIVHVYHQKPAMMAQLVIIASVIGIGFKPLLGHLIDRLGERKMIMAEAAAFIFVCLGYAAADHLGLGEAALTLIFACFIIDLLLGAISMARSTYLHKNLVKPSDLTPTLSMGVSLDHVVAMTIPILGGMMITRWGHETIFLAAAALSIVNLFTAARIREEKQEK